MFKTLRDALKIKDIRSRIIYTFLMLVIIRIGSQLPIPGVNTAVFSAWFAAQTANGMGFFDAITGGSFYNMSIFALNVSYKQYTCFFRFLPHNFLFILNYIKTNAGFCAYKTRHPID